MRLGLLSRESTFQTILSSGWHFFLCPQFVGQRPSFSRMKMRHEGSGGEGLGLPTGAQIMDKFNKEGDCPSWTHPAPHLCPPSTVSLHRVDNNHLLLLMIHVFRENEEQLFRVRWSPSISHKGPALCPHQPWAESSFLSTQMIRMSTGHMEGNLQLIYVLLTDCYVYLIRKGIPSRQPLNSAAGREACLISGFSINQSTIAH